MGNATLSAETFRAIRKREKLTQAELAEFLGRDSGQISRYERGKLPIPRAIMLGMAWVAVHGANEPRFFS